MHELHRVMRVKKLIPMYEIIFASHSWKGAKIIIRNAAVVKNIIFENRYWKTAVILFHFKILVVQLAICRYECR